jgi:hypothetical protein
VEQARAVMGEPVCAIADELQAAWFADTAAARA